MKKAVFSLFALLGLGLSVAMPLNVRAEGIQKSLQHQDQPQARRHQDQYEVFSRRNKRAPWKSEGTYSSKDEALRAVRRLHDKGLIAVYEKH